MLYFIFCYLIRHSSRCSGQLIPPILKCGDTPSSLCHHSVLFHLNTSFCLQYIHAILTPTNGIKGHTGLNLAEYTHILLH